MYSLAEFSNRRGRKRGSKNKPDSMDAYYAATRKGFGSSNRLKAQYGTSIALGGLGGGLMGYNSVTGNKRLMGLGAGIGAAGIIGSAITGHQARQKGGYYKNRKETWTNY